MTGKPFRLVALAATGVLGLLACGAGGADDSSPKTYRAEASLPKGWPTPGPFDQVVEKTFPAYKVAETKSGSANFAFWRLFKHIKSNDIPMTAPVTMAMDSEEKDSFKMEAMGFVYPSIETASPNIDPKVKVAAVPARKSLVYAWIGPRTDKKVAQARAALDQKLAAEKKTASQFILLGYNGPSVPKNARTHELQAILD